MAKVRAPKKQPTKAKAKSKVTKTKKELNKNQRVMPMKSTSPAKEKAPAATKVKKGMKHTSKITAPTKGKGQSEGRRLDPAMFWGATGQRENEDRLWTAFGRK